MGLFALPYDVKTRQEAIDCLKANIAIWDDYAAKGQDLDYLLGFMQDSLNKAKELPFVVEPAS
ncbi:hypothetical protein CcrRB23_gp452 [Caulobacter phage RB23]|nr:hypothetical protein CcrRB23_gp452 [Caulobacter phage RB23]